MDLRSRSFLLFCSLLLFTAILSFYLLPSTYHLESSFPYPAQNRDSFAAPKPNVWAELSRAEADEIYDFAFSELPDLHLVKKPKSAKENSIFTVETLKPNKTDTVPYYYGDGDAPERWAKMVLAQNINDEPYLVYYAVGPLPISERSRISPLEYPFNSGRNKVKSPFTDYTSIIEFGNQLGRNISDVTKKLLGAVVESDPDDPKGLLCLPRPTRQTENKVVLWFQFFRAGVGSGGRTLLPQGVYVQVDASSANQMEWSTTGYFYNGVLYDSIEDFRAAIAKPSFQSTPPNLDGNWTETEDFDSAPAGRELPPPIPVQPYGPRYKLDRKEKFVSWFGFEFYITTAQATGLSLFDIRFKGERIMYELGLQEAMAHYAGDDPMAGGQEFLDTFFGMGKNMFEMLKGYDCPAYSDTL